MSSQRRGYPLGALFVVVTGCAVLVAGVTPLVRLVFSGEQEVGPFLASLGAGALCGLVIGILTGLIQFRSPLGTGLGALAGTLIGGMAGIMTLLRANQLAEASAAMTAGCALIVGVALVMRRRGQ